MGFGNIELRSVGAQPGPCRALKFKIVLPWYGEKGYLIQLAGQVEFHSRVVSERLVLMDDPWNRERNGVVVPDRRYDAVLLMPVSDAAIRHIETERGEGDVAFHGNMSYVWQRESDPAAMWESVQLSVTIPRSEWLKRLKEMEWEEHELFEIHTLPLVHDAPLKIALERLREAQTALRHADFPGVLVKCRACMESAAKHKSRGDTRKGFALLLETAFPRDTEKQGAYDKLIGGLKAVADTLGRHEQYPPIQVAREEAEFCFVATVGLLSMLSRRLVQTSAAPRAKPAREAK